MGLVSGGAAMNASFSTFAFRTKQRPGHSAGQMHGHSARLPPINSSFDRERAARESERPADNAKIRDNERAGGREGGREGGKGQGTRETDRGKRRVNSRVNGPRTVAEGGAGRWPLIGASPGPAGDVIIFMTFQFKSNALLNGASLCARSNLQRYFTSGRCPLDASANMQHA